MLTFKRKNNKPQFTKRSLLNTKIISPSIRAAAKNDNLRIIPLGGLEEVGKNMTLYEYGNEIMIVDMGLMFPTESMLGIDYVIPDITYLKKHKQKIKGLVLTHGHLDHIGAIPYILPKFDKLKIYGTALTLAFVKDRLEEFGMLDKVNLITFSAEDKLKIGSNFNLEFFRVNHNIPDGVAVVTAVPSGVLVVQTGDFKFDHTPVDGRPADMGRIASIGSRGVSLLLSDSTNAEKPGHAISESQIGRNIDKIFDETKGRIIFATFSTLISRIQQAITASTIHGRKVAISGLSMEKAVRIVIDLGNLKTPRNAVISLKQARNLPDNKVTILTTGSQGEEASSLYRMSLGEHREVKITKNDTVVISATPIPGNERAVYYMMDNLFKFGANVYYDKLLDIHTSGHGRQEDLKLMLSLVKPKYFMPVHGEYHMLAAHARIARSMNWPEKNVLLLTNGRILEINKKLEARILRETVPSGYVMVDGLGVGDVGNVVLRDRQVMAKDGMFVVIMVIDKRTGVLVAEPSIVSRGFIYVKESDELMGGAKKLVKRLMEGKNKSQISANWPILKKQIRDAIGAYLFQKTERRPVVLPVIMEA